MLCLVLDAADDLTDDLQSRIRAAVRASRRNRSPSSAARSSASFAWLCVASTSGTATVQRLPIRSSGGHVLAGIASDEHEVRLREVAARRQTIDGVVAGDQLEGKCDGGATLVAARYFAGTSENLCTLSHQSHAEVPGLSQAMQNLTRSSHALQAMVMQVRMIPVEAVFLRFPRLVRDLSTKLGKQVELDVKTDPNLLGGFVAQIGSEIWDASVSGKIHKFRDSLT